MSVSEATLTWIVPERLRPVHARVLHLSPGLPPLNSVGNPLNRWSVTTGAPAKLQAATWLPCAHGFNIAKHSLLVAILSHMGQLPAPAGQSLLLRMPFLRFMLTCEQFWPPKSKSDLQSL
ncbi:hypothetical protein IRJ41_023435 [Triplophysa rosa]|uniref:Uncharacterized protein n=1 Tax=Triplophysa rosa TaxID=992332 RepID=A0A9W7TH83_TRIRA|nr:hypothetical protein IRJ41_023435 [Triplophysa rosa]